MTEIRVDGRATMSALENLFRDQLPFATSLALNRTAKIVQEALRAHLAEVFTIRRPWVLQGITIPRFSDKHDSPMMVSVELDPKRAFLAKFEAGGVKQGSPILPIAIPSTALRPSFSDMPPLAFYPKNLRLSPRRDVVGVLPALKHTTRRGVVQTQGKDRTFVLDQTMFGIRVAGVYQRIGPGRHDIRLLWTYKDRIPIPARLQFEATAVATVQAVWPEQYEAAFQQAVRTAR
jgi:hypothetical protein